MTAEVSIIIPVFNKATYLSECLDSVLCQSFKAMEIICIDDASGDQSGEILCSFANKDSRLRVITNTENLGPAQSRNKGIESARGKFMRFVDADDLLPQKSIENLYARAIEDDVELVKGSLALFRGNDPSVYLDVIAVPDKVRTHLSKEKCLWIPWWHTSFLISADLVHRNHLRYPNLIRGEDPVFLTSVLINTECLSFVREIVYLYRKYPKASGSGGSTWQFMVDTFKHAVMTKHLFTQQNPDCWYLGYGPFLLSDVRDLISRCELNPDQQCFIEAELCNIWGNDALNF